MPELIFFRQLRADGGIRTGVSIDGPTELERFESGSSDEDPALLWFIDVRSSGRRLPGDAEGARQWFLSNAAWIKAGLSDFADEISAGIDADVFPLKRPIAGAPTGARSYIVCSAIRRIDGLKLAKVVRGLQRNWETWVDELEPVGAR
jgi:hypothetical protein